MSEQSKRATCQRKPNCLKGIQVNTVKDTIDHIVKRIREFKDPRERLESMLFVCAKLSVEIDACYTLQKRYLKYVEELEERIVELEKAQGSAK